MAKKLILLILVLPLVLMIVLFSATKTVSRNIKVNVSSVEYLGTEYVYLDLDNGETYDVEYAVYPTSAEIKTVSYEVTPIEGKTECQLDIDKLNSENKVVPLSPGSAMVTIITNDGGFKDSFIVEVFSGKIEKIFSSVTKSNLLVGESVKIVNRFLPENATDTVVRYVSDNEEVVTVNNRTGRILAVGKGTATVTVISEVYEHITSSVTITVENEDMMDISTSKETTMQSYGSIKISMDAEGVQYSLVCEFFDEYGNKLGDDVISGEFETTVGGNSVLNYSFNETDFVGKVTCRVTCESVFEPIVKEFEIEKVSNISIDFDLDGEDGEGYPIMVGQNGQLPLVITPENARVSLDVKVSREGIVTVGATSDRILITADSMGLVTLTVTATDLDHPTAQDVKTVDVLVMPKTLSLLGVSTEYGIERIMTLGKTNYDGTLSTPYNMSYESNTDIAEDVKGYIKWHTTNDAMSVSENGDIIFNDDTFNGTVGFYAELAYGGASLKTPTHYIKCIADGVNVYNYVDLLHATRLEKKVVLRDNIIKGFGYDENGKLTYETIHTTYDDTYYGESDADVYVLLKIKNDIYGNGYEINAHNVAYGLDSSGALSSEALFKGPLNFVAMTESASNGSQGGMISVKGQDNIAFAVYENVTLSNVILKSCDLEADENNQYDLVDLNYVGTTVEVLGDNVNIEYSRILNGRTVIRAFGDIDDPTKVINLNIKNSVLSTAREFILRMGSNCFEQGSYDDPSPYLDGDSAETNEHETKKVYNTLSEEEQNEYDEKYIKTFVTVENSVFRDAGIFAIGIDSHFAGKALANGEQAGIDLNNTTLANFLKHWKDLAKTSYGAKLTFKGDVRIYNWKNLEEIDSTTLIEITGESQFGDDLQFNVNELIKDIQKNPNFANIVYKKGSKEYVHAGICFFGGGKNYGVFDYDGYEWQKFTSYEISLADINKAPLTAAAGEENFYFFLHDRTNINFLPEDQESILSSKDAYSNIYKQ